MGVIIRLLWLCCAVVVFNIVQCNTITRLPEAPIETTPENHRTQRSLHMNIGSSSCEYTPNFSFLRHQIVSYRVANEPRNCSLTGMSKSFVEELTARALAAWAPHCGLHFARQDQGPVNILISFEQGDHGDRFPFESNGTVAAHTIDTSPNTYDIHINDPGSDEFLARAYNSHDMKRTLYTIILHEIGHALGLYHLSEQDAVMYDSADKAMQELHITDINCMRARYGLRILAKRTF